MMCSGLLLARPISSLKEALAAVLLHLGGLLPPHLGYNPHSHAVTHDWLWSVGGHPMSFTSTGEPGVLACPVDMWAGVGFATMRYLLHPTNNRTILIGLSSFPDTGAPLCLPSSYQALLFGVVDTTNRNSLSFHLLPYGYPLPSPSVGCCYHLHTGHPPVPCGLKSVSCCVWL